MLESTQSSSDSESTTSEYKRVHLDSSDFSEGPTPICPRCQHYKSLEEAVSTIEDSLPYVNELKWCAYAVLWLGVGLLFVTLLWQDKMCAALDKLEKELL